jgi:hypothetical protein
VPSFHYQHEQPCQSYSIAVILATATITMPRARKAAPRIRFSRVELYVAIRCEFVAPENRTIMTMETTATFEESCWYPGITSSGKPA